MPFCLTASRLDPRKRTTPLLTMRSISCLACALVSSRVSPQSVAYTDRYSTAISRPSISTSILIISASDFESFFGRTTLPYKPSSKDLPCNLVYMSCCLMAISLELKECCRSAQRCLTWILLQTRSERKQQTDSEQYGVGNQFSSCCELLG